MKIMAYSLLLIVGLFPAFLCLSFPSTSPILNNRQHPSSFFPSSTRIHPNIALQQSLLRVDDTTGNILNYLPLQGRDFPPDMKELVQEATLQCQTFSSSPKIGLQLENVVEAIDFEYKISDRPVIFFSANSTKMIMSQEIGNNKILAVCLFHQIPACVACRLLPVASDIRRALASADGWKAISFPEGIRVQIRSDQVSSTLSRQDLPPRKVTNEMADSLLEKAHSTALPSITKPPMTILQALEEEFRKAKFIKNDINVPFFPKDKFVWVNSFKRRLLNSLKLVKKFAEQLNSKLAQAGRAGFLVYGFLNFVLYAGSTIFQWRRFEGVGMAKLAKVLGSVYVGSQVTKLPRIALAVALAPFGNRALDWLQFRLEISEGQAFAILTVGLFASFFGVLTFLTIGSTVM
jgi:hypothetical protein